MIRGKGSQKAMMNLIESKNFIGTINKLVNPHATITEYDNWMPKSIHLYKEAELKDFLRHNFSPALADGILNWWLQIKHSKAATPKWDFVSTCNINGKRGMLLVEAKAHAGELEGESKGKSLDKNASANSKANHNKIGRAIGGANREINKRVSGVSISRDKCYQLSNRVAHAWWLAHRGIPVVLLYLGVVSCLDMNNGKNILFKSDADWQKCFANHASHVGVDILLNHWVNCGKSSFITICKSF